jgi:hypothetical protein
MLYRHTKNLFMAGLLGLLVATGCRGPKVALYADAPVVEDGVRISIRDAYVRGNRVVVRAQVENRGAEALLVARDDFALRLEDGSKIPSRAGTRTHKPVHIPRGGEARITVEFRSEEVRDLDRATLLLAGKSFEKSESLGEVSLSSGHSVKSLAKNKPHKSRRKRHEPAVVTDEEVESASTTEQTEEETGEPSETEEPTADEQPADEAEGEDWVIGEN